MVREPGRAPHHRFQGILRTDVGPTRAPPSPAAHSAAAYIHPAVPPDRHVVGVHHFSGATATASIWPPSQIECGYSDGLAEE